MKAFLRRLVPQPHFAFDIADWTFGAMAGWRLGAGGGFIVWIGPLELGLGWDW